MDAETAVLITSGIIYIFFSLGMLYLFFQTLDRDLRYRKDYKFMYPHFRLWLIFETFLITFFTLTIGITLHVFITSAYDTLYGQLVLYSELIGQTIVFFWIMYCLSE